MPEPSALSSLSKLDYPAEKIEVLLAIGSRPARQRNLAAGQSAGDILLFLDDDSSVEPGVLRRNLSFYGDEHTAGVGGPALPLAPTGTVQAAVDLVLASLYGDPRGCKRFAARGEASVASEDELILCNLSLRRDVFQRFEGFHEGLYPNEENALFQRVLNSGEGWRFMYVPDAPIRRPRPATVWEFAKKIFRYGTGRFEQTRVQPSLVCALRLMTVLFPLYWLSLPFTAMATPLAFIPAVLYAAGALLMAGKIWLTVRSLRLAAASLALFPVLHSAYPLGILWAATGRMVLGRRRRDGDIEIRRLKSFGEDWS